MSSVVELGRGCGRGHGGDGSRGKGGRGSWPLSYTKKKVGKKEKKRKKKNIHESSSSSFVVMVGQLFRLCSLSLVPCPTL